MGNFCSCCLEWLNSNEISDSSDVSEVVEPTASRRETAVVDNNDSGSYGLYASYGVRIEGIDDLEIIIL